MSAVRRSWPVLITCVAAMLFFWTAVGPPAPHERTWGERIVEGTPREIWFSSHLGQALNYGVLTLVRATVATDFSAFQAIALDAYLMGALYLLAIVVLARSLDATGQRLFVALAALSPVTILFHGHRGSFIGYPVPFLLLAVGVHRLWLDRPRERRLGIGFLGGLAAALHGVGLFFLPGILLMYAAETGPWRRPAAFALRTAEALSVFFGVSGAAVLLYMLCFRDVSIIPGDAHGGAASLLLPLFSEVPETVGFRAYSFFSLLHLSDIAVMLLWGAPALCMALAYAPFRRAVVARELRSDPAPWLLGLMGLLFIVWWYPAVDVVVAASGAVAALAVLQTLSLLFLIAAHRGTARLIWFAVLLSADAVALAVMWAKVSGAF